MPRRSRQYALLGIIFAIVLAALIAGYWLLLRPGYAVLVEGVRPAEAAAIVTELDKGGVAYRLKDGGTTILVPEDRADATRLAIAGSNLATTGQVGFELFNKSDMGLTNFAQKINYQRALQGELVRTIMHMDGVESARVHLALPERALFRDDRTEPSAAVTIALKAGHLFDPARVGGIQRLVAAAVPDLPAARVAVLDARGRVISQTVAMDAATDTADQPAALEERTAVERYYRARARSVIEGQLPQTRFTLQALLLPQDPTADAIDWSPADEGGARNYAIRVTLVTASALDATLQTAIRAALAPALGFRPGDELRFETGPLNAPAMLTPPAPTYAAVSPPLPAPAPYDGGMPSAWWLIVPALAAAALLARRRPTGQPLLSATEHDAFAQTLRRQLALIDEADHAAR